jgi:hypothetical protein
MQAIVFSEHSQVQSLKALPLPFWFWFAVYFFEQDESI